MRRVRQVHQQWRWAQPVDCKPGNAGNRMILNSRGLFLAVPRPVLELIDEAEVHADRPANMVESILDSWAGTTDLETIP